ncbi:MAG: hypothetical protein QOI68_3065, partial [Pseudonocardiales bacterium]|nr:hypothetical protein [Pseudonocardiales bacterium]
MIGWATDVIMAHPVPSGKGGRARAGGSPGWRPEKEVGKPVQR